MRTPFFSIIIPTLNEEKYIGRILGDLSKQKQVLFEVIVVDGRSKDNTVKVAKGYQKKLSRLLLLSSRVQNVSEQRNKGAARARGDYLLFLDADVRMPARFLAEVKRQLVTTQPAYATTYISTTSKKIANKVFIWVCNMLMETSRFLGRPFVNGFDFIVKRSVFVQSGGFRSSVVFGEDYDLSLRLFSAGYSLVYFTTPTLVTSLRRLKREGWLRVVRNNVSATWHTLVKGPITKPLFSYPMGGKTN